MLIRSRPALTDTMSVRLTVEERKSLESRADDAGLSLSEWSRQALLASTATSPQTRLLLSEIIAVRKLVTGIQLRVARQAPVDGATIMAFAAEVDASKFGWADERITEYFAQAAASGGENEEPEDSEDDETEPEEDDTA